MSWQLLILVAIFYYHGLIPIMQKKIGAIKGSRTRKLVWQYFFAALIAIIAAMVFGQIDFSWATLVISAIGVANAFSCYCLYRAYDISMSRASMLSNLDDMLAIGLGYIFLGELAVLTPMLIVGISVSLLCALVFSRERFKHQSSGSTGKPLALLGWVLGYSLIWGIAMFFGRFFALQGINVLSFGAAWYFGSWFGALLTRYLIMGSDEAGPPLSPGQKAKVLLLAFAIWLSLILSYQIRTLIPITIQQPIELVAEMSLPTIIGLTMFKEAQGMTRREKAMIIGGLVGATLIAFNF